MKKVHLIVIAALAFFASSANARSVLLSEEADVRMALAMTAAVQALIGEVATCLEAPGGVSSTCECKLLETCPFPEAYVRASAAYCQAQSQHPNWRGAIVQVFNEETRESLLIGMPGLDDMFGHECPRRKRSNSPISA